MKYTFLVPLLVLSLYASSSSQARLDGPQGLGRSLATIEGDSARISTRTLKSQYEAGEDIVLDISLRNLGAKPFSAADGNDTPDFFFDIEVTGPLGKSVPFLPSHSRGRNLPESRSWSVSNQEPREASIWLNNLFALDDVGKYKVVVSKKFVRDGKVVTVESSPLIFGIVSAPRIAEWR